MKVLITGASGYLAKSVIRHLRLDYELTLFDRVLPSGEFADLPFVQGDITAYEDVEKVTAGQDAVVHLVALVRERIGMPLGLFCDVMVKGTWNVAEACIKNGVRRLVNISSVIADGWPSQTDQPHRVTDTPNFAAGDLFYSLAKYLGEDIGHAYAQAHGLSVINLRPAVIYGDGANPEPKRPENPPPHWFMFVDPRDIAQAIDRALQTELASGTFNVIAGRDDALWEWQDTAEQLGYAPQYNWPEIPQL